MNKRSRITAILVTVLTVFALMPVLCFNTGKANAAEGDPAITLGTEVLRQNANFGSGVQKLWYGGDDWYVIAYEGEDGDGNLLSYTYEDKEMRLHPEGVVTFLHVTADEKTQYKWNFASYDYYDSDLRTYINNWLSTRFTDSEKSAMAVRALISKANGQYRPDSVGGTNVYDLLWPLTEAKASKLPKEILIFPLIHLLRCPGDRQKGNLHVYQRQHLGEQRD